MEHILTRQLRSHCVTAAAALLVTLLTFAAMAQDGDGSEDAVALFNAGQDLHEHGDLAGAIKLYDKALKALPEFPEAEYQRGMAELALGQTDEAEKSFRRALVIREDWTPAATALGSLLVKIGKFDEADELLSKTLESDPQNSAALAAIVDLRLKTKSSPTVLQNLLDKVTALTAKANPTAGIWVARAALESALIRPDDARSSLASALAIDPKNRSALFLTADIALKSGDILRAEEAAATLEKLNAEKAALGELKANIAAANDPNAADSVALKKQLESDPKNLALLARLCASLRRDEPLNAAGYCRRASEIEPSNVTFAVGYAAALVQAKQLDPAIFALRKLIEIAPDNSTAHANLGTALFEQKRYAEAREQYEWLTAKQPNLAAAYFFLAVCYDRLGKDFDAMANYQQYLRLADAGKNKSDIEKVNLRLAQMQKKRK